MTVPNASGSACAAARMHMASSMGHQRSFASDAAFLRRLTTSNASSGCALVRDSVRKGQLCLAVARFEALRVAHGLLAVLETLLVPRKGTQVLQSSGKRGWYRCSSSSARAAPYSRGQNAGSIRICLALLAVVHACASSRPRDRPSTNLHRTIADESHCYLGRRHAQARVSH